MGNKVIINLAGLSATDLLEANSHKINSRTGDKYYNLPQWFKTTDIPNVAEILYKDQLPDEVKLFIRNVSIKQALERLVFLHGCEQEGLASGQPSAKDWLEAVQDAETALNEDI